jgi:hypothetical protein
VKALVELVRVTVGATDVRTAGAPSGGEAVAAK